MILLFEFKTGASHAVLENFLINISNEFNVEYFLRYEDKKVLFFILGDEEFLLDFSNKLSIYLPTSIFIDSFSARVVDEVFGEKREIKKCNLFLPFSPKMVEEVLNEDSAHYYNPFIKPSVGVGLKEDNELIFKDKNLTITSKTSSFKEIFEKVAKKLFSGEGIDILTATGRFHVTVLGDEKIQDDKYIFMPCDLSLVEKMCVIKSYQSEALASLEKPILRLPINSIFAQKNIILDRFVHVKLADDILLLLLTKELFKLGVEFIKISPNLKQKSTLEYEGVTREPLYLTVLENSTHLILNNSIYTPKESKESLSAFKEPSIRQSARVLKEQNLFNKNVVLLYFSKKHSDEIAFYSEDKGFVDLVKFNLPKDASSIVEAIEKSKTGKRLIENFSNKFSENFNNFKNLNFENHPNNLFTIFGAVGVLFGLGKNIEIGANLVLDKAFVFGGLKGPSIDFKLNDESLRGEFNTTRFFKSIMSYLLAGADLETLSFALIDSLGFFISNFLDRTKDELNSTNLIISGSLFENERVSEVIIRQAKVRHQVSTAYELPLDE